MAEKENSSVPGTKDKLWKCKTCKITFPDIYSYTEHLESKDHIKGVMKEKYGEKYLEAKAKLDEKFPKAQPKAPEEKKKLPVKDIKLTLSSSSSESSEDEDDVYTCEVCRKICTGFLNYQLHLEGKKHNKTVAKLKLLKQMRKKQLIPEESEEKPEEESLLDRIVTKTHFASADIECKICNKKCCGPEAFKQHCKSTAHQKKLAMQDLLHEMESEGICSPLDGDDSIFAHCEICQKGFSGPLPYKQHMDSISHLKQERHVQQLSKIKDLIISSEEDSKFQCKECGKAFSGPVPFNAHLKSFAHGKLKKKTDLLENLEKKHPEMIKGPTLKNFVCDDSDDEETVVLGCKICHIVFSGPEAARDHFTSTKHKRAVKKKIHFQKFKKLQQEGKSLVVSPGSKEKLKTSKLPENDDSSDFGDEFDIIS